MVALQAMSQYSLKVSGSENDLDIDVLSRRSGLENSVFSLNEGNKLLLQRRKLTVLPDDLNVTVTGQGCFMVQTVLRYNVHQSPEVEAFSLEVSQVN